MPTERERSCSGKELQAVRFNHNEQRCLKKRITGLKQEGACSINLINQTHKSIKVGYKNLKDKVSKIKTHLTVKEIDQYRKMEEEGKLEIFKNVAKPDSEGRISNHAKKLNLDFENTEAISKHSDDVSIIDFFGDEELSRKDKLLREICDMNERFNAAQEHDRKNENNNVLFKRSKSLKTKKAGNKPASDYETDLSISGSEQRFDDSTIEGHGQGYTKENTMRPATALAFSSKTEINEIRRCASSMANTKITSSPREKETKIRRSKSVKSSGTTETEYSKEFKPLNKKVKGGKIRRSKSVVQKDNRKTQTVLKAMPEVVNKPALKIHSSSTFVSEIDNEPCTSDEDVGTKSNNESNAKSDIYSKRLSQVNDETSIKSNTSAECISEVDIQKTLKSDTDSKRISKVDNEPTFKTSIEIIDDNVDDFQIEKTLTSEENDIKKENDEKMKNTKDVDTKTTNLKHSHSVKECHSSARSVEKESMDSKLKRRHTSKTASAYSSVSNSLNNTPRDKRASVCTSKNSRRPTSEPPGTSNQHILNKRAISALSAKGSENVSKILAGMNGPQKAPFDCHAAAEKQEKEPVSPKNYFEDGRTKFLSRDSIESNLGHDLHEELRKELLREEEIKATKIEDRICNFMDKIGDKLRSEKEQEYLGKPRLLTMEELLSKNPDNMNKRRVNVRRKTKFYEEQKRRLEQLEFRRSSESWKDVNKCRYLRIEESKIDLSGINTLATEQMSLLHGLKFRYEAIV